MLNYSLPPHFCSTAVEGDDVPTPTATAGRVLGIAVQGRGVAAGSGGAAAGTTGRVVRLPPNGRSNAKLDGVLQRANAILHSGGRQAQPEAGSTGRSNDATLPFRPVRPGGAGGPLVKSWARGSKTGLQVGMRCRLQPAKLPCLVT